MQDSTRKPIHWALSPIPTLMHVALASVWLLTSPADQYLFALAYIDETFFGDSLLGILVGIPLFGALSVIFWQGLICGMFRAMDKAISAANVD